MYDYGSARELHLDKAFAAMKLTTRGGKVPPHTVDGHTLLIDERYFKIERWPVKAKTRPPLIAPVPVVQMQFVVQGRIRISGEGFESFAVERNQLAVIPSSAPRWEVEGDEATEIIRILPSAN
jgi:mannose-6-phosphate isomerase